MKRTIISIIYMLLMTLDICAQGAEFETASEAVKNMKVGWNLTNALACSYSEEEMDKNNIPQTWKKYNLTTKDYETVWGNPVTKPNLIKMLRKAGINAIRIPVAWWLHMELDGTVDRVWMNRVHEVVDYVIDQGMYCILNKAFDDWTRVYPQDYDNKRVLFEKLWKQIAEEFKDYDDHLLFEGYNELLDKYESWGFAASNASSGYNTDDAMEAYETLGKYAQSFVDVVRATGGGNKTRNLIVNTYCGASANSDWGGELMVEPLEKFKLPKDRDNNHLIIGVHAYYNTYSLQEAKRYVDLTMDNLNTYLVPKGVPVIISEWGADERKTCWYKYPENTLAFARYFMENASRNGFVAFDWTGPSSYGKYRSMPAFEVPELTTAILKGYYGDSYQPELLTTDNYDYQFTLGTFEGQWCEMNLYDNEPLNTDEYVGMKLEMAEVADPGFLRIVVRGSNDEQRQYEDIYSLSTTLTFDPSELGGKVSQVTIQNARYNGPYVAKVVRALFIKKDGSEQELDEISNIGGCDVKLVMPRKQFVHTVEFDGNGSELNVFEDDIPLKLKSYKGIRVEFAVPVSSDEFQFKFYGDNDDEDFRPVIDGLSITIDFEKLKFTQTINRIVLQHTQEGKAEVKIISVWLIYPDGTEEYCDISAFHGCDITKIEDYIPPSEFSYTINEMVEDKIMRSTTGKGKLESEVAIPYRRYNMKDGKLYFKGPSGGPKGLEYNHYFTLTTEGQTENLYYDQTDVADVVFLAEAEDIPGMTLCDNANMLVRSSNSAAAYAANGSIAFVTLPAGAYQLTAFIHDSNKNPDSNWSFLAGNKEIANFHCDVVNIQEFHSDVFTLTKETTLYIPQNGGPRNGIDLIYITKQKMVTITANDLTMVYGDDVPTLTFKTEGGELNGTPSLSTTATKTSPVGTYPITVSQGSVSNSNVTYVAGTLTITKAPLTIKAGLYTKKQGEDNPVFALTYDGFKNKETRSVLEKKPTVTCEATKESEPGEYAVKVSDAEAQNYDISYVNGKLVVTQADAVVLTAKSYTRVYGDANPTFEFTTSGATLTGTPQITCEATATSPVGTYDIIISQGSVTNYNVTYVKGTLTITKVPLTVGVQDVTITEGDAIPTFTLTYEGFRNDDTESTAFATKPKATTTATSSSKPGIYPITVSGGDAKNYELSYQAGTLTVKEKEQEPEQPVTITANDLTMVYGDNVPTLTFKTEGDELNGTPSLSTTATKTSPVGTYPITVSQGSVTNSNVIYVAGTLTITKAPLTIKAGSYTKKQGEDNPVFALTYNGFKNNETRSVLTKKPTVTCEATKDSPPGDYEIIVSGAEAQNYDISYQSGWLKIEEAQGIQSVVIDGQPFDVYNIQGRKVRSGITTLKGLPKGVYIINGIKVVL